MSKTDKPRKTHLHALKMLSETATGVVYRGARDTRGNFRWACMFAETVPNTDRVPDGPFNYHAPGELHRHREVIPNDVMKELLEMGLAELVHPGDEAVMNGPARLSQKGKLELRLWR